MFLVVFLLVFTSVVTAVEDSYQECNFGTLEQMQKDKNCNCTKQRPAKIVVPKTIKFLGVCGLKILQANTEYEEIWGDFYYKTDKTFSGVVTYQPANAGDLYFAVKNNKALGDSFDGGDYKFAGTKLEMGKLKLPRNPEAPCITAKATI